MIPSLNVIQNKVLKKKKTPNQPIIKNCTFENLAQSKNLTKPNFSLIQILSMFVQNSFDSGKKLIMYFTCILQP